MKLYHVQITEGESSGGLAGPTGNYNDMRDFQPGEEHRGKLVQLIRSDTKDSEYREPLFDWDWEIGAWAPSNKAMVIRLGSKAPSLAEQLADQGIDEKLIASWQRDADAINRLYAREIITLEERDRARRRLANFIALGE